MDLDYSLVNLYQSFRNVRIERFFNFDNERVEMTLARYSKDDFGQKLSSVVNPTTTIRSIQHLKGRDQQLEEIERALYAAGRHIFIFGDRGVGKSSLSAFNVDR